MKLKQTLSLLLLIAVLSGIAGCHWEAPTGSTGTTPPPSGTSATQPTSTAADPLPPLVSFQPKFHDLLDYTIDKMIQEAETVLQEHEVFRLRYHLILNMYVYGAVSVSNKALDEDEQTFRKEILQNTIHFDGVELFNSELMTDLLEVRDAYITVETSDDPRCRYYQRFLVFLAMLAERYPEGVLVDIIDEDNTDYPNRRFPPAIPYSGAYVCSAFQDFGWKSADDAPANNYFDSNKVDFLYYLSFGGYPYISKVSSTLFPAYLSGYPSSLNLYDEALKALGLPTYSPTFRPH